MGNDEETLISACGYYGKLSWLMRCLISPRRRRCRILLESLIYNGIMILIVLFWTGETSNKFIWKVFALKITKNVSNIKLSNSFGKTNFIYVFFLGRKIRFCGCIKCWRKQFNFMLVFYIFVRDKTCRLYIWYDVLRNTKRT